MSEKKEIKIGETVEWVKTVKSGRTVTFEKKEGKIRYKLPRNIIEQYKKDFVAMGDI